MLPAVMRSGSNDRHLAGSCPASYLGLLADHSSHRAQPAKAQDFGDGLAVAAEGARALAGIAIEVSRALGPALGHGRRAGGLQHAGMQAVDIVVKVEGDDAGRRAKSESEAGARIAAGP